MDNNRYHLYFLFLLVFLVVAGQIASPTVAMGQTKIVIPKIEKKTSNKKTPKSGKATSSRKKENKTRNGMSDNHREAILQNLINNMVQVKGGSFTMGATPEQESEAGGDEKPAHKVIVPSFSIGKYEVTQEEWFAVMGTNPSHFKGDKRPVEQISWNDCQQFIDRLNKLTGKQFRLPTEAEWEFAARGGTICGNCKFAGGNIADDVAWYNDNSNGETHEVGKKRANELGLYDMAGNVWEWCNDQKFNYSSSTSEQLPEETSLSQNNNTIDLTDNPQGSNKNRVNRGGSWRSSAKLCRVSFRFDDDADERFNTLGLRLAL